MDTVVAQRGVVELDIDPFCPRSLLVDFDENDRAIRESAEIVRLPRYNLYAVPRYEQVAKIFGDWRNFTSAAGTGLTNVRTEEPWREPSVILEQDPPDHTRTRTVVSRILGPSALAKLRADLSVIADTMIDELVERGTFDGIADLCYAFVYRVLPDAVGFSEQGRENLLPYAAMAFNAQGPRNEFYHAAFSQAESVLAWVDAQCKRENLSGTGFGAEIYAAADAGAITYAEAALLIRTFITAALDTTIYAIGRGLVLLATHPDQWKIVSERPELAKNAFDEALRHSGSTPYVVRTTNHETEFCGVTLPPEQKILLMLGAANRDPRRWEDPERFDIMRKKLPHVAFGTGIHGCVGQVVARLEAELIYGAMAQRVARIELTGEPASLVNNWLRGHTRIPMRFVPR